MSTSQAAGWYPDPSGMPDTFRWWDGGRWTHALSPRADAPPPPGPKPVVDDESSPAAPAAGGEQTGGEPTGGEPTGGEPTGGAPTGEEPDGDESASDDQSIGGRSEGESADRVSGDQPSDETAEADPGTATGASAPTGADAPGVPSAAAPPEAADAPGTADARGEPPPPGAPGPEYLPPPTPPADHRAPEPEPTGDPGGHRRQNLRSVLVLAIILAVLAGAGVLGWRLWSPGGADTAAPPPTPTPPRSSPEPTPSSPEGPSQKPTSPSPHQPSESAKLVFDPLDGGWKKSPRAAMLSSGFAQTQVTQHDYDGRTDWIAMVSAGTAPRMAQRGPLDERAKAVGAWFRQVGFAPMKVDVNTVDDKEITVDGRPAHLLVQRFSYDRPALTSTSDLVTIVVVDMGERNPTGVFLASVPNTDRGLSVDVDNARRSLHVAE